MGCRTWLSGTVLAHFGTGDVPEENSCFRNSKQEVYVWRDRMHAPHIFASGVVRLISSRDFSLNEVPEAPFFFEHLGKGEI